MLNQQTPKAYQSDVTIELVEPFEMPEGLSYAEKHELLSSQDRDIRVAHKGEHKYTCTVPKHIFNPYGSMVPRRVVELVLDGAINVTGRRVVDLGCGSGFVGLSAILMGCEEIMFSDINPNVVPLREHPMLRPQDSVKVQDILVDEADNSWDAVIACPPSQRLHKAAQHDSYESGIFVSDDLIPRIIVDTARVLKPGGELSMYVRMPHRHFLDAYEFMQQLDQHFDLGTMNMLDFATGSDFPYGDPDTSALLFSIKTKAG
jgi:SAM-dependent methyltransferase